MKVKDIIYEDFVNYFKPSMFIIMPTCSFKCDNECGRPVCQNSALAAAPTIEINNEEIIENFYKNPISEAICIGGLEPFDTFEELFTFLIEYKNYGIKNKKLAYDIVIYTGYEPNEIQDKLKALKELSLPIIIKFGRFIPDSNSVYDAVLGVELASENQWAARLSNLKLEEN